MDKEKANINEPPSLADPIAAPEAEPNHGAVAEEGRGEIVGGVHEAEAVVVVNEDHPPIPMPPPLLVAQESPMMPVVPAPQHDVHEPVNVAMAVIAAPDVDVTATDHITITDQVRAFFPILMPFCSLQTSIQKFSCIFPLSLSGCALWKGRTNQPSHWQPALP